MINLQQILIITSVFLITINSLDAIDTPFELYESYEKYI